MNYSNFCNNHLKLLYPDGNSPVEQKDRHNPIVLHFETEKEYMHKHPAVSWLKCYNYQLTMLLPGQPVSNQ